MLLADLGAEVIKVEGPSGDDTRTWRPPVRGETATYYLGVNRNKRSIVLDFADPADAVLARELAHRADVVIENFRPGGLARFGLDYETVAAAQSQDHLCLDQRLRHDAEGRGAARLRPDRAGHLRSDEPHRDPDGPPYRAGISVFDVMAGLHATIGLLAALHERHETGRGQHVEVNLLSSALSGLVNHSSAYVAGGVVPFRMGNSHPSLFPYEPLPCADGELIITAGNDGQFRKLCEVLELPGLAEDPRFAHNQDRTANRDELRPLLVERLQTRTKQEWFRDIIAAGVPCGPINTIDAGVAFAEEIGLDPVVEVGPAGSAVPSVRNPITLSESPVDYRYPPPGLDEHGAEIRAWLEGDRMTEPLEFPTSLGTSDADHIRLLGLDLADDLMGQVGFRRTGVLAGRPAPADAVGGPGLRGRAGRACRSWIHPDRDRGPADLPVRAGFAAGRAGRGAARRRLPVPRGDRGLREVSARSALAGREDDLPPTTPTGMRSRWRPCGRPERGAVRPRARPSGAQDRGPAYAGVDQDRDGGGTPRAAPAAVRGDRPGP